MNESTFERCDHDRENPYVMISREMAQDKSISPKAKGVLLYLLSLPRDWKIYHSQLQEGLGVGEDYINSAIEELIANGYADRTRERIKGIFQPYKYKIREFKKSHPNLKNRPGSAGPVNPALQSKERENKYKKQQQAASAAAAAPLKKAKEQKASIHPCLESVDIPEKEKIWLTKKYDEETVKNAIAWATSPQTKITTTLTQAIKWACAERPEMPLDSKASVKENKDFAKQYDEVQNEYAKIHALNKHVEITPLRGQSQPLIIEYIERDFATKFKQARVKYRFTG